MTGKTWQEGFASREFSVDRRYITLPIYFGPASYMTINHIKERGIIVSHVMSSVGFAGGERYVHDLIKHSQQDIRHLVVLPSEGPFEGVLKSCGYDYVIVKMEKKFSLRSLRLLANHIKENNVDIVHTHGYRANFYGGIACIIGGVRNVSTVHVSLYDYVDTPLLKRWIYILLERMLSFRTSKFVCISSAMKRDMLRLGIDGDRIAVIQNGVDLKRFYPRPARGQVRKELGIEGGGPVIGTVGRMVTEKGQKYLIEALRGLKMEWKDLKCVFVGEGPLLPELKKTVSRYGLGDTCIFTGFRADIEFIYPIFDAFVLPSIREPFGLVLLEAMASGVPVLATDSGGPREFITSGVNGVLVPPKDPRALASGIRFLLLDRDARIRISKAGMRTVNEHFDVEETARKIVDIYYAV